MRPETPRMLSVCKEGVERIKSSPPTMDELNAQMKQPEINTASPFDDLLSPMFPMTLRDDHADVLSIATLDESWDLNTLGKCTWLESFFPSGNCLDEGLKAQLLLNGIFGLSARFSTSLFHSMDPVNRGNQFTERASALWDEIYKDHKSDIRSLQCLQGLILVTFNALQSGPSEHAWSLCGHCVRLAYDLDLHTIDANYDHREESLDEWVALEEKRRAWWTIWEMDTFSSAMSRRPFAIDCRFTQVLLPVSDIAWYNKTRVPSGFLNLHLDMPWKCLCDSPNQEPRAWFLISLAAFRHSFEVMLLPEAHPQLLHDAEAMIACFALALPQNFQTDSGSMVFNKTNFARNNWIVCTLIILQCARSLIEVKMHQLGMNNSKSYETSFSARPSDIMSRNLHQTCTSSLSELISAAQSMSPQYIPVCSPFILCALLGPGTAHVPDDRLSQADRSNQLCAETIRLILRNYGRYWVIGKVLMGTPHLLVDWFQG
ncbi:hypothetical protein TSTA_028940 [Talaromyces stipitatus ATCC 10500]|uniref:Xylanolytic transcriptional activator regulatory domain-containing protein n=1 Tax=Talaromyces stipitatus (strain ATCC 10500 / CBS 375.48 / QM 6759 / NRRL 1006) TaxID=441959 RepID=B8M507_TALSN|nr:uncharacterized protein TSTA_028940 [Talaromyces stipitatus ATCC 10500]EED19613.1 hypothetical protein TSTA_028940 [Talaromyces stipitatus ATCC 10500]